MSPQFTLNDILTEYDENIGSELNIDPLGLLVIWSFYGQKIFNRRISSNSNDVRNYTLNLFNHGVIRSLIEDDSVVLSPKLNNIKAYAGRGKDSLAFKQACLIYLENLFTYIMIDAESSPRASVETSGVLGIAKARRQWDANLTVVFSHEADAHVLVRQNSLGVSGRYKTPLVEMKFFDGSYDYALPEAQPQWKKAREHLFLKRKPLGPLYDLVREHLKALLAENHAKPRRQFSDIPNDLKKAMVTAFRTPRTVGDYSRDFWLSVTGLDQGAAGALLRALEAKPFVGGYDDLSETLFAQAATDREIAEEERSKLNNIRRLEPFLAELDLMLSVMLSSATQSLDDAAVAWQSLGRDASTLPVLAQKIRLDTGMRDQVIGTAAERLNALLEVALGGTTQEQMRALHQYHENVMQHRGQSPWLRRTGTDRIKVDVRVHRLPDAQQRPPGHWVHHYYLPQFHHWLNGLRGNA
jgi:hypothetical protein